MSECTSTLRSVLMSVSWLQYRSETDLTFVIETASSRHSEIGIVLIA